jgi:hypothetical protein
MKKILLLFIALLVSERSLAIELSAFTKPGAPPRVFLTWTPDTTAGPVLRYNIYRKLPADAAFPATPINATPIAPITNCATFKTVIPMGSAGWNELANAFADSVTNVPLADVCSIANFVKLTPEWWRLMNFVRASANVAIVTGYGYNDNTVANGTTYLYRIRRVLPNGTELPASGGDEVTITAGTPAPIPAPVNVRLVVGDAKIQVLWNKPADPKNRSFNVHRANGAIPYRRVNDPEISTDVYFDMDSNAVVPAPANGLTDYERWDSAGNPQPRSIPGIPGSFSGPHNGTLYNYKVQLKDILGNVGPFSAVVGGTPVDHTPPATPTDIFVLANEANSTIEIRWPKVLKDVEGHKDSINTYRVYRYAKGESPNDPSTFLVPAVAQLTDTSWTLTKIDNGTLRNPCKDSVHWYRVEAWDLAGNKSQRSVSVSATLRDTTKPKTPKDVSAEGRSDHIRIKWKPNGDCNIDRYLIYRAFCDYGDWLPCPDTTRKIDPKTGGVIGGTTYNPNTAAGHDRDPKNPKKPQECGGPFELVGTLTHQDALARVATGLTYWDDYTVPSASPICYAYLVKAQDISQNISGTLPIPTVPPEIIVCERLRDKTPPEPAIIAGLFARDSAIRVDIIGPPVQDIAAYHIYRADTVTGPYKWVGGFKVEPPPLVGYELADPYKPPPTVGCDSIPLKSNPYMSAATFIDKKVDRHKIYWYKALGVDQNGNETPVDSAMSLTTFTFASNRPVAPKISSINAVEGPCALNVKWTPGFSADNMLGFVIFRASTAAGPYLQLENVVESDSYNDNSVARGTQYWYRIGMLMKDGLMTRLSDPKSATHP